MKKHSLFRVLVLVAALTLLLPLCASAKSRGHEPLISIDLDEAMAQGAAFSQSAYYQSRWLQVTAQVEGSQTVTLRVYLQGSGSGAKEKSVYKRVTRNVKERYQSPEIFLDYHGTDVTSYRVELSYADGTVKSAVFHRLLLNLNNNTACLRGLRFRDVDPSITDQWFSFRPINLKNVEDGTSLEIIGSNMYSLGQLVIRRSAQNEVLFEIVDYDQLFPSVGASAGKPAAPSPFPADHDINFSSVRLGVYHKLADVTDPSHSGVPNTLKLNQWYSLSHKGLNGPVILYLNARVSYNPNGLPRVDARQDQSALLRLLDRFAY